MSRMLEKQLLQTAPFDLKKAFNCCTARQVSDLKILLNYLEARKQNSPKGNCSQFNSEEKICLLIYVDIQKKTVPEICFAYGLTKNSVYYVVGKLRAYCKILNILDEKIEKENRFSISYSLTNNEQQILHLLANGYSIWGIANEQRVAIINVEAQIRTLYRKTGTQHMQGLIVYALKKGIVAIDGFNCCFLDTKFLSSSRE